MVVIERHKFLLRDRLVFFPSREELDCLTELSPMDIVRVSQAREPLRSTLRGSLRSHGRRRRPGDRPGSRARHSREGSKSVM